MTEDYIPTERHYARIDRHNPISCKKCGKKLPYTIALSISQENGFCSSACENSHMTEFERWLTETCVYNMIKESWDVNAVPIMPVLIKERTDDEILSDFRHWRWARRLYRVLVE